MRSFHAIWIIYFILFLVTGCVAVNKDAPTLQLASKDKPIQAGEHTAKLLKTAVMSKEHELVENEDKERLLYVSLHMIPGSLAGMPLLKKPVLIRTRLGDDFVLPLAELQRIVDPLAEPANTSMRASGIAITPADTRLLRIGTFFQADFPTKELLGAGFVDMVRHQSVALAYFDRACSIVGDVHEGDLVISFSLKIPNAGLYWLRSDNTNPKHWQTKLEEPNTALWYALIR
jgi:hypothetical protein